MSNIQDEALKQAARKYLRFLESDNLSILPTEIDKAQKDMLQAAMLWAQNEAIEKSRLVRHER